VEVVEAQTLVELPEELVDVSLCDREQRLATSDTGKGMMHLRRSEPEDAEVSVWKIEGS